VLAGEPAAAVALPRRLPLCPPVCCRCADLHAAPMQVGKLDLDGLAHAFLHLADVRSPEPQLLERLLRVTLVKVNSCKPPHLTGLLVALARLRYRPHRWGRPGAALRCAVVCVQ
jgi:hypothetical protein